MIRYDQRLQRLAYGLAALAGFVDAIGFLKSGGYFVSFMSGNSTRLAVGAVDMAESAAIAAALIGLFVLGVVAAKVATERIRALHRKVVATACVAGLLTAASIGELVGPGAVTIALLCLAMGAVNTVFQRDGDVSVGVSYMTGTLVKLGLRLADMILGGDRSAWQPYFLLWLSLVLGGAAGAMIYALSPSASLWVATLIAAGLTGTAYAVTEQQPH